MVSIQLLDVVPPMKLKELLIINYNISAGGVRNYRTFVHWLVYSLINIVILSIDVWCLLHAGEC